jgi:hypothetical protein
MKETCTLMNDYIPKNSYLSPSLIGNLCRSHFESGLIRLINSQVIMPLLKGKLQLNSPCKQKLIMDCVLACLPRIYLARTSLGARAASPES